MSVARHVDAGRDTRWTERATCDGSARDRATSERPQAPHVPPQALCPHRPRRSSGARVAAAPASAAGRTGVGWGTAGMAGLLAVPANISNTAPEMIAAGHPQEGRQFANAALRLGVSALWGVLLAHSLAHTHTQVSSLTIALRSARPPPCIAARTRDAPRVCHKASRRPRPQGPRRAPGGQAPPPWLTCGEAGTPPAVTVPGAAQAKARWRRSPAPT